MSHDELPHSVMGHVQSFFQRHLNWSITLGSALGPVLVTFALKAEQERNVHQMIMVFKKDHLQSPIQVNGLWNNRF